MFKISWLWFTLFNSLAITIINCNSFIYVYNLLEKNLWLTFGIVVMYFGLVQMIFSILFLKYLTKFFSIFFLFCACVSVYFISFYGIIIDSTMIQNIVQTDSREVKDLFNIRIVIFCLVLLFMCIVILMTRISSQKTFKKAVFIRIWSFLLGFVFFMAVFLPLTKSYIPFFRNHNEIRMYNIPFYQIYAVYRYYTLRMKEKKELESLANDAYRENNSTKKLFVLVVGETARAANYSLGTYTKNDTNTYTKNQQVIFFDNASSCGTSTAVSLPCMFSVSKRKEFSPSEYKENILDILHKIGVKTVWYDNNYGFCKGVCARIESENIQAEYDGALLESLRKQLHSLDTQNIIILHLQGSHGPSYYKRYPKEFKVFHPTCDTNELDKCSNEALENTYDNTLLYTDYLLSQIIALLKEQKDYESALLYLSDHGESLGENGIYLHAIPYFIAPKYQTHIPVIFWSNQADLMKRASQHSHFAISHDNLFSTLLGFFQVQTSLYEDEFDLLSPNLKAYN
ncbi:phosphoethanolamine--lipid A transferase [Campylobacter sp. MIT 21-1685]|uniref:phosphoethanolamine transferase n=1 Tax=unclassified Campylobacter TaxID=2593542 RepID=UPI00224AC43A|nr:MULTISPECIES: phosphoethanolamine--lipid A transferase [unclassified Campylobacter]MCX2683071.1 phosphoethanolamine--lipid A transferase [Campylobacter sp. MIT 21-1684]MCX2751353.1 phosphoethanolamine--lipid A transferase [Campylobacter sp. MIT 21-1682]MCX2807552.1 phosphoethanolamine--lipid A transferase [Campylobacter sp. MIT 21-1685]